MAVSHRPRAVNKQVKANGPADFDGRPTIRYEAEGEEYLARATGDNTSVTALGNFSLRLTTTSLCFRMDRREKTLIDDRR
jgi:hypothetical protein